MQRGGPENEIEALIALMARLPGLGPRSARRAVLHLLRKRTALLAPLATALAQVGEKAQDCTMCGGVSLAPSCPICTDPARANGVLCVVESVADMWAMERAGAFGGRYHVLGGTLSALDAMGPEELRLPALARRVADEGLQEVILALNATVEGQTTAHYIAELLQVTGVQISSLAQGVPVGGELDYLDDGTIAAALKARGRV